MGVPLSDKATARRLGFAAIAAVTLHAIFASLLPNSRPPHVTETVVPATFARVERRPIPTPRPTPQVTPRANPLAS
ncbi:MAG TPA: hypothetical protein VGF18_06860, partial [Candidatus Tumulicola sp.]